MRSNEGGTVRAFTGFLIDFCLLLLATLFALLLRENLELSADRFFNAAPYLAATALAAAIVIPLSGLNRTIWRMSSTPDYLRVLAAIVVIVVGALAVSFAFNRLDNIARSLPILQILVAAAFLGGGRALARLHHTGRQTRKTAIAPLQVVSEQPMQTVLVVGLSRLTETYLQSIVELAPNRIKVAGLLGRSDRQIGRLVGAHKILGRPEQIEKIVSDLELHGVTIDRIVVTKPFESLNENAREALLEIEQTGSIELQLLVEDLGFGTPPANTSTTTENDDATDSPKLSFAIAPDVIDTIAHRKYWALKRFLDFTLAAILLTVTAPIMLVISTLIALNIGLPVAFWQQRPGLGGRPFRLYKLRTMAAVRGPDGRRLSDEERTTPFGNFLRRTRLDELPQLFNILRGDMSFVGPRPLLPRDQADAYRARLLVRPGLTGWAQVVGGRIISPEDKAVLDVWYVQNACLQLDLEIIARTIPMVLFGERTYNALIARAWRDLSAAGVLRGQMEHAAHDHMRTAA